MSGISDRLKKLRKLHKMSQKEVAKFLGITESGYGYYEQGRNEPSIDMLEKLADKYDVTIDYIIGRSNQPHLTEDEAFYAFIKDPKLRRWFKELPKSEEEDIARLKRIWEAFKEDE